MNIEIYFTIVLYFSILIFSGLIAYVIQTTKDKSLEFVLRVLLFLVLFVPSICRYNIGADYHTYDISYSNHNIYFSEIGFSYICNALLYQHLSSWWLFTVIAFITYFPISFLLEKDKLFFFVISYILFMSYLRSYDQIRQACSLPYLVLSLQCLDKKKTFSFILASFIAYSMHVSSLLFTILLILSRFIKKQKTYYVVLVIGVFLVVSGLLKKLIILIISLIIPAYAHYLESNYIESANMGSGLGLLLSLIFPVYMIFCEEKQNKNSSLLMMNTMFVILRMATVQFDILGRVADVVWCGSLYSYNNLVFVNSKYRKIVIFLFFAIGLLLFYRGITSQIGEGTSKITPYISIFQK